MCPPPPLELVAEIVGEEDEFNGAWWEHNPACTPPPIEDLAIAAPAGTYVHSGTVADVLQAAKKADDMPVRDRWASKEGERMASAG
jgi:hypothetical protein